jgi:putative ABC transport system ATP-binding protein
MLLEVRELTKEYKRSNALFPAVDKVNLSVARDDFVSIIGRSGSGKSTLLNLIAGLLRPTAGSISVDGQDVLSLDDRGISRYRNATIGYVPQGQSALANLTVLDNVQLPFYLFKRDGSALARAQSLLEEVGISHLAEAYPKQLSGGELRRVSIARALINRPAILIADEPTSDLDTQTTAEIMQLFAQISKQGTAVLLVTHELDTVSYGDSVYRMEAGRLAQAQAPPTPQAPPPAQAATGSGAAGSA